MTAIFTSDEDREAAASMKLLLARIEAGQGEDRALGADIIDALDAPRTFGNPSAEIDAAYRLASWLKQDPNDVVRSVFHVKRESCSHDQLARLICATILKVHLAKLERAPA